MKFAGILLIIAASAAFCTGMSLQQAMNAAENRIEHDGHGLTHSIADGFTLTRADGTTPAAYVFQLTPRGYIITSCEDNITPVIAYSYMDNCTDRNCKVNPLFDLVRADMTQRLDQLNETPEQLLENNRAAWSQLLNGETAPDPLFEQWPPAGATPTQGWLRENWTQGAPYNMYCPMDLISGSRSVAGCPAVAMGAILNYLECTNGTRFNDDDDYYHNYHEYYWIDDDFVAHDFPSWPELNMLLDTLETHYAAGSITNSDKAAIVYASGAACTQVYTSSVSGTFGVDQAYDAYMRFGFTGCELLDDTSDSLYSRMAQNMMDAIPIHLAIIDEGPQYGHNVVVDGYNTDEFFHINFGWGGSSNGWYSFPLTGMPYGMNIIEGVILDIGEPVQSAGEIMEGCTVGISISSLTNPASSFVNVELLASESSTVVISIYSITGRLVQTTLLPLNTGANDLTISTCGIDAGVYLLRASNSSAEDTELFTVLN